MSIHGQVLCQLRIVTDLAVRKYSLRKWLQTVTATIAVGLIPRSTAASARSGRRGGSRNATRCRFAFRSARFFYDPVMQQGTGLEPA